MLSVTEVGIEGVVCVEQGVPVMSFGLIQVMLSVDQERVECIALNWLIMVTWCTMR